ncbi:MAG: hypothetical protein WCE79_07170 [Xanthobacteraceae bacterium]
MGRYEPLTEFLRNKRTDRIEMTFSQIEDVIGRKLPPSAVFYRSWWSNNPSNSVMTKAWRDAGFLSEQVDMDARTVVFSRTDSVSEKQGQTKGGQSAPPARSLYGWLEGTVRVAPGVDLTEPADPDWGKRAYE